MLKLEKVTQGARELHIYMHVYTRVWCLQLGLVQGRARLVFELGLGAGATHLEDSK